MPPSLLSHDRKGVVPILLALTFCTVVTAQSITTGPQVTTFLSDIDESDQPYGLYVPKNYTANKTWPLVISLHGAGSNHRLNLRRVFGKGNFSGETDSEATRYFPKFREVEFIVATPLARGTMGYRGLAEKDVFDVLADVRKRFNIDEDRIYLTGLSMGGGGAMWIGLTRPDIWAAIAPVCPAIPPGADMMAGNARNVPIHLFHGALDPTVPVTVSRDWHKRLQDLGYPVEYTEYPLVKHNSWDNAYKDGAVFDWFAKHKRNRFPQRVTFTTTRYKYSTAYWLAITGLETGTQASIDAEFKARNKLHITTANVDALALNLKGHPSYAAQLPLEITIDGTVLRGKATQFQRSAGKWKVASATVSQHKQAGLEGPLSEVVASRHLYVYGTLDNPSPEERERRRREAAQAAEWSTARSKLYLNLRAVADTDVRPADINESNLLLFGTKETNSVIAKLADKLPMQLNAGAADYGLLYVWPNGNRYVAVNSGVTFFRGMDRTRRASNPGSLLDTFGDFILFRGSLENILVEGRFDREWRLKPEDRTKILESGAVEVK